MSLWGRLKKRINKEKNGTVKELSNSLMLFHYTTFDRYLYLLEKAGFLETSYGHLLIDNNISIPVKNFKLIHEIPKHLTIKDAHRIASGETWLIWFKYKPQSEGVKS